MDAELGVTNVEKTPTWFSCRRQPWSASTRRQRPTNQIQWDLDCQLSYLEVKVQQPEYCQWVVKTHREGPTCYRLQRLALWLEETKDVTMKPMPVLNTKGYKKPAASSSSDSQAMMHVMQQLMHKMENMEEELEEVRGLAGTVDPSLCRCSDSHEQKKGESTLSDEAVRFLQDINQDVAANVFSDVTRRGPVVLMEEACSPERRQSAEVQRITGQEGSAIRCSQWSGSDLSTGDGVKLKLQLIDHHRPMQLLMRDQGFERLGFCVMGRNKPYLGCDR